jgi:hypothetical protein
MQSLLSLKCFLLLCATELTLFISNASMSHGRYILPSHTVLSSDGIEQVTLTASISNDQFHPDLPLGDSGHGKTPEPLVGLFKLLQSTATLPAGDTVSGPAWQAFARFSVADQLLETNGTYRVRLTQPPTPMTTFVDAEGNPNRRFGPQPKLPEGAKNIVRRMITSHTETYISKGEPTFDALQPSGQGIELSGNSHPNDLFVGEAADFTLTLAGKPLTQAAEIHLVRGGTRHRNQREEQAIKTDTTGQFSLTFTEPGFYHLEAEITQPGSNNPDVDMEHYSLYITLEVFPQ